MTEPVEIDHWCGKDKAHPPHGGCNGFGMHAGSGRQPAPQPLPKHTGPRRSSRTGAIRRQCFPPTADQAVAEACRWCEEPHRGHGQRYTAGAGWHAYTAPGTDLIASRMRNKYGVTRPDVCLDDEYHVAGVYCGEPSHCTSPYTDALPGTPYLTEAAPNPGGVE